MSLCGMFTHDPPQHYNAMTQIHVNAESAAALSTTVCARAHVCLYTHHIQLDCFQDKSLENQQPGTAEWKRMRADTERKKKKEDKLRFVSNRNNLSVFRC